MISYHPMSAVAPVGQHFTRGFRTVDTNDPERLARGIAKYAWSPSVFKDGYRVKGNFLFADWLALDFEDPDFSLADAVKSFSDMTHVIGTTRNHQVAKADQPPMDRFRVLLLLERRCASLQDYEWTLRRLSHRYPIDRSCVDGARHYYRCLHVVSVLADGYAADIHTAPPQVSPAERLAALAPLRAAGVLPPWMAHVLTHGVRPGRRSNTAYQLGCRFAELGFGLEDALARALASPLGAIGAERLAQSLSNGFRRAQAEMEVPDGRNCPDQPGEEERKDPDQRGLLADRPDTYGRTSG